MSLSIIANARIHFAVGGKIGMNPDTHRGDVAGVATHRVAALCQHPADRIQRILKPPADDTHT